MHLAVDGSLLVDHPNSIESLHLVEWLSMLSSTSARITLLYPQAELPELPAEVETYAIARSRGMLGTLAFEQREVPHGASVIGADAILVGEGRVPLASPCPIIALSALASPQRVPGFGGSIASAAGQAGTRGAAAVLTPRDAGEEPGKQTYTPFISETLRDSIPRDEEPYVLCHAFTPEDVSLILSAWTWVDGSLGDSYPLVLPGIDRDIIEPLAEELDISDSVEIRPGASFGDLPSLYGGAAAQVSTAFAASGQALRWSLVAEIPVIALHTPRFEAVLGGAAYLVPPKDSRKLGAACLTVLIQERVSEPLRERGRQLAKDYTWTDESEIMEMLSGIVAERKGATKNGA